MSKLIVRSFLVALIVCSSGVSLFAQKFELNGYGGYVFPHHDSFANFANSPIWGGKFGVYLTNNLEFEGNFGYITKFNLKTDPNPADGLFGISRPATRAFLYDAMLTWNFGSSKALGTTIAPFVTFGAGGLRANVVSRDAVLISGGGFTFDTAGDVIPNPNPPVILDNGDTFLTLIYGGGVKANKLWGGLGLRSDVRIRTIPNFFGKTINYVPELTGGINFTWGEP